VIRPTEHVLRAFAALEGNHDFQVVLSWIETSRESDRDAMEQAVDASRQLVIAGQARSLSEIVKTARSARETLRKTG
jgi:uncharacterized protein YbaA (DUF1428 family)